MTPLTEDTPRGTNAHDDLVQESSVEPRSCLACIHVSAPVAPFQDHSAFSNASLCRENLKSLEDLVKMY